MELAVAIIAGLICICGAIGVIGFRNPVHNALSLVATLFGVAVIFIAQGAYFLAAIQVIVYAGAIVVVFLFVITASTAATAPPVARSTASHVPGDIEVSPSR